MKTRCRPWQVAWMEILDEGRPLPPEATSHLAKCPDCRAWVRYLEAEREAAARWTPPAIPARAWVPALLRRTPARHLGWTWALAGLVLVALGVNLWRAVDHPVPTPADTDWTGAVTLWMDWDGATEPSDTEEVPSYLERSGLWWTEDDLQTLGQTEVPPSGRSRPLESAGPRRAEHARLTV